VFDSTKMKSLVKTFPGSNFQRDTKCSVSLLLIDGGNCQ
jgi:hypothetical protein